MTEPNIQADADAAVAAIRQINDIDGVTVLAEPEITPEGGTADVSLRILVDREVAQHD